MTLFIARSCPILTKKERDLAIQFKNKKCPNIAMNIKPKRLHKQSKYSKAITIPALWIWKAKVSNKDLISLEICDDGALILRKLEESNATPTA